MQKRTSREDKQQEPTFLIIPILLVVLNRATLPCEERRVLPAYNAITVIDFTIYVLVCCVLLLKLSTQLLRTAFVRTTLASKQVGKARLEYDFDRAEK